MTGFAAELRSAVERRRSARERKRMRVEDRFTVELRSAVERRRAAKEFVRDRSLHADRLASCLADLVRELSRRQHARQRNLHTHLMREMRDRAMAHPDLRPEGLEMTTSTDFDSDVLVMALWVPLLLTLVVGGMAASTVVELADAIAGMKTQSPPELSKRARKRQRRQHEKSPSVATPRRPPTRRVLTYR